MKFIETNLILVIGMLSSCIHTLENKDIKNSQKSPSNNLGISNLGDHDHPRFSPDGTKLIFASKNRPNHKGSQIYEFDLTTQKERRVTYSDGDALDPNYSNENEILYSSTTDEIKEELSLSTKEQSQFLPTEIYQSDRFGGDINRLTNLPGYDSQAIWFSEGSSPSIIYISSHNHIQSLQLFDLSNQSVTVISSDTHKEYKSPSLSKDQDTLVYIEKNNKSGKESIMLYSFKDQRSEVLLSSRDTYHSVFYAPRSPQRVFYSVRHKNSKYYQIEMIDLETKCFQVIAQEIGSLFSPTLSDDLIEKLAYVKAANNQNQIVITSLNKNAKFCPRTKKTVTLFK